MNPEVIIRGALGHPASFGDLYDARTDNFCGISIFKDSIPPSSLTIQDDDLGSNTEVHLINSDSLTEMFSKLEVDPEQHVSMRAGLFPLHSSWSGLGERKKYARSVKSSLLCKMKTKYEKVNFFREDLRNSFTTSDIDRGIATHVVVGIYWGANTVLSCACDNVENWEKNGIEEILSSQLENVATSILERRSVDMSGSEAQNDISIQLRIFGDCIPSGEILPTSFEEAANQMSQIPSLVKSSNDGKGVPVSYRMIPITRLQHYFNFSVKIDVTLGTLTESTLVKIVKLFEEMSEINQELNEGYKDTYDSSCTLRDEDMSYISTLQEKMSVQESLLREILSSVLREVRSRKKDGREVDNLIKRFKAIAPLKRPGSAQFLEMVPQEKKVKG